MKCETIRNPIAKCGLLAVVLLAMLSVTITAWALDTELAAHHRSQAGPVRLLQSKVLHDVGQVVGGSDVPDGAWQLKSGGVRCGVPREMNRVAESDNASIDVTCIEMKLRSPRTATIN